jgi:septum formation protein
VSDVPRLVLASASPARLHLLTSAGIEPEVLVSGVDESVVAADGGAELSLALARMKAEAVAATLGASDRAADHLLVLGCDSVLELDGEILGKPADAADATRRWQQMRGRSGVLHTGHCVIELRSGRRAEASDETVVTFANVTDDEIEAYVASGEPLQVAGAFKIDGLGAPFVARLDGNHTNVIGLSMPTLRELLASLGVGIIDLWRPNPLT